MNPLRTEMKALKAAQPRMASLPTRPQEATAQQLLFLAPASSDTGFPVSGPFEKRGTSALKPHPSLLKLDLRPTNERLLALEKLGEAIDDQPLFITKEGLIIDGYARWLIACRQQRTTMFCQVCELSEPEALKRILQTHCRPEWLNAFCRAWLALELEPGFSEQARANQSAGGKQKLSSKLTEDYRLDCRKQIASLAGISTGNVSKVKQILQAGVTIEVIEALRSGEIRIHKAWILSKLSIEEQKCDLGNRRIRKRTAMRIRNLNSKNIPHCRLLADSLRHLSLGLTGLKNSPIMASHWPQIDQLIDAVAQVLPLTRRNADARQEDIKGDTDRQSEPLGQCADKTRGPREFPEGARLPNLRARG